jgi:hypothetical protein
MADQQHLKRLKQGVRIWNQWRNEHPYGNLDLSEANLSRANLSGANLYEALQLHLFVGSVPSSQLGVRLRS